MSLLAYEELFSRLKMNTMGGGEKSPHKVAMLLAVMDLVERNVIKKNEVYFDQNLKEAFTKRFLELATENDRNNPHLPFFHLRSSGFWHHHIKPGRTDEYGKLDRVGSPGLLNENIAFAYLDDELFELLTNLVARELLKTALYKNISVNERKSILDVGNGWDWLECEFIVHDYFEMLTKEMRGESYSKAEHRRALLERLNNRSEGAIEFKHQNISAILLEMGQPYISGYKPAFNYQQQLKHVVLAYMAGNQGELEEIVETAQIQIPIELPVIRDWSSVFDSEIPDRIPTIAEPQRKYLARKTNYTERETRNRGLGEKGENFVIEYERYRMETSGRSDLVKEIKWASKEEGDGLGYDIRSFNPEKDEELFIEVKTTNSGKYQPFFVSDNELAFSKEMECNYRLYRVYEFNRHSRLFILPGAIDRHVTLTPKQFKASF